MSTLWLIGMMGSGKSTVAPIVAARIGRPWYDTDAEIALRSGVAIDELVASDESAFRALERAEVGRLAGEDAVVACGGGVVLDRFTVTLMRATGLVVHLAVPTSVLASRVGEGVGRPLLAGGVESALALIAEQRGDLYGAAAHVVVDADETEEVVTDRVLDAWTPSS